MLRENINYLTINYLSFSFFSSLFYNKSGGKPRKKTLKKKMEAA